MAERRKPKMSWWRAYASARNDPKVQRLPGETFKAWFNLLCLACEHDGVLPALADVAYELRKPEDESSAVIVELHKAGLFDETRRGWEPHNWNGRQYKSDVSTDRVQQFRKRRRNVSETPSETEQSRAERTEAKASVGEPTRKEPKHGKSGTRLAEEWRLTPDLADYARDRGLDPGETAAAFADHWTASNGPNAVKRDWDAAFRTWCRRASTDSRGPVGAGRMAAVRPARGNDSVIEHLARLAHSDREPGTGNDGL